ncbi:MAG: asparagine synthase (glutamine-hydrolyzing) [Planctomycetota bacterium]|nr:asparagine synthase (glutamine-hydrolyzing) [Planctomycetota bacterium]
MCGILGIVTSVGQRVAVTPSEVVRCRDRMAHRGPDGAGVWDGGHVVLAHRRLAVIDPSEAGAQPMLARAAAADAGCPGVLVYNGELYNDAALREELSRAGWTFRSQADSETVLAALMTWGEDGLDRLRGMYALAFVEAGGRRVLLARDPLGIKPLFWTRLTRGGVEHVAFASEIAALLELPGVVKRADIVAASAYLTTIRTTLGERTLYEGVRTLEPGGAAWVEAGAGRVRMRAIERRGVPVFRGTGEDARARVREVIEASVSAHLRADVPTCTLLSGGLDSTIITGITRRVCPRVRTYCAGAADGEDLVFARRAAASLGTRHAEAIIERDDFVGTWARMVARLGVPLSTPNEVAIERVATRLRADGHVVALTGEGADELFGGYEAPMRAAAAFERGAWSGGGDPPANGGAFQLLDAAWVPPSAKPGVLRDEVWRGIEGDAELQRWYVETFDACAAEARGAADRGAHPLDPHLRFLRRVNLAGLLGRLDTATMLAGVEGRTPFADVEVASLADALPMDEKFDERTPGTAGTKVALRRAFADGVPPEVLQRAKASFPLPFQAWVGAWVGGDGASVLRESGLVRELFTEAAIETVIARGRDLWRLSWPMANLALWSRTF